MRGRNLIGFSFTFNNSERSDIKLSFDSFDVLSKEQEESSNYLHLLDDKNASMLSSSGYTFYVIGTLVYKNKWNKSALDIVLSDLLNGENLSNIARDARGQYCLVVYSGNNVSVITDKLGSVPIYIYEKNGSVQISNIFPLLAEKNTVTLNLQGLAEFISARDPFCLDCTLFQEIKKLEPGTVYKFGKESEAVSYYNALENIAFNKYTDINEISDLTREMLADNLSFLREEDKVFADITGGFDSRLGATLMKRNGIEYTGGICGDQILGETALAREVAQKLEIIFKEDCNTQDYGEFKEAVDMHYRISCGIPQVYHSSELINYYGRIAQAYKIHVTGFEGTELLSMHPEQIEEISDKNKKIDIYKYLKKRGGYFKYIDVLNDGTISENDYYGALHKKITKLTGEMGSDNSGDVWGPLYFAIYSRNYHAPAIGTHNCIVPQYSPYFEASIAKLMFETQSNLKFEHKLQKDILSALDPSIASIMTTHGYTANMDSKNTSNALVNSSKYFIKKAANTEGFLGDTMGLLKDYLNRKQIAAAESERPYWVEEIVKNADEDMRIYDVVNKVKVGKFLKKCSDKNRFKAKLLYLNNIFEQFDPII